MLCSTIIITRTTTSITKDNEEEKKGCPTTIADIAVVVKVDIVHMSFRSTKGGTITALRRARRVHPQSYRW